MESLLFARPCHRKRHERYQYDYLATIICSTDAGSRGGSTRKLVFSLAGPCMKPTKLPLPRIFANSCDEGVVHRLSSSALGDLTTDAFAARIFQGDIVGLRIALIKIYIAAGKQRYTARATKSQIAEARKGLSLACEAACHLHRARPAAWQGLGPVLGLEPDDQKGTAELNVLVETCRQAEHDISRIASRLDTAIRAELAKSTQRGERKKRLRSLVEALGDWWQSMGKSLTITVDASRRGPWRGQKQTAVVHGRRGEFLDFAEALLCEVDVFKRSEVVSTVVNVYKAGIAKRQVRA
jgi:hypothetical protein